MTISWSCPHIQINHYIYIYIYNILITFRRKTLIYKAIKNQINFVFLRIRWNHLDLTRLCEKIYRKIDNNVGKKIDVKLLRALNLVGNKLITIPTAENRNYWCSRWNQSHCVSTHNDTTLLLLLLHNSLLFVYFQIYLIYKFNSPTWHGLLTVIWGQKLRVRITPIYLHHIMIFFMIA